MSIILDTHYNITEIQANYYDKVATDSLFSNIYLSNYYTKTDIGSSLGAYTNSVGLHNVFFVSKASMSIILDTHYNITETQANYFDKVATDSLFPNIDVSNYYAKIEVDDIDNELSTLVLNTYTKTEVGTLLYTSYPSLSFIVDNFYSETEIDSSLSDCITSTQIDDSYYTKSEIDTTLNLYSPSAQILSN